MKNEAHITLRAPQAFNDLLEKQSAALGMSRSNFIVQSVLSSIRNGFLPSATANPAVWDDLLKNWEKLPSRPATAQDDAELSALEAAKRTPSKWMDSGEALAFVKGQRGKAVQPSEIARRMRELDKSVSKLLAQVEADSAALARAPKNRA